MIARQWERFDLKRIAAAAYMRESLRCSIPDYADHLWQQARDCEQEALRMIETRAVGFARERWGEAHESNLPCYTCVQTGGNDAPCDCWYCPRCGGAPLCEMHAMWGNGCPCCNPTIQLSEEENEAISD